MNKYSFVLPAYKARFFKEAVDSILAQTYTDFELIIVNDASPEDLESIVNSYNDPRIRYYRNEQNIGGKDLVAQWNHCLEYAKGEYIILASDDDVYFPQYLEKMNALVEKYPDVNVFRPRIQLINAKGEMSDLESYLKEYSTTLEFVYSWMKGYIKSGIPYYLFKKTALQSNGGFVNFPLAWFSDDATVIGLSKDGIVCCSDILFSFRHSGESISNKHNDKSFLRNKLEAMSSFYPLLKDMISKTVARSIDEDFYKKYIFINIDNCIRGHSLYLMNCSSIKAILCNWIMLRKYLSLKRMLLSLYSNFKRNIL